MQRTRVKLNAGNLLETIAAAIGVYGVYKLAGGGWALIAAFVLLVALAEWCFPTSEWRVPLPRKPQPKTRLLERRQALQIRWYRLKARRRVSREPGPGVRADPDTVGVDPETRG